MFRIVMRDWIAEAKMREAMSMFGNTMRRGLAIGLMTAVLSGAAPAGTLPTAKDVKDDLARFDQQRIELRNKLVKGVVQTYIYYTRNWEGVEKAKKLLTDLKAHIASMRERADSLDASELAEWARSYDGIGAQIEKVKESFEKSYPMDHAFRDAWKDSGDHETRFKTLFPWFQDARKKFGKGPEAREHRGGFLWLETKIDDEIVPGKWAKDFANDGQTPNAADKHSHLDVNEGDLDDSGWEAKKSEILLNYEGYLKAIGSQAGAFVGFLGRDPEHYEKTGDWEQEEAAAAEAPAGSGGGGGFKGFLSFIAALAKEHGAKTRASSTQATDLDALTGGQSAQGAGTGGSGTTTGAGNGTGSPAAPTGTAAAPTGSGASTGAGTEGASADGSGTANDGPAPGQVYTVQSGDTLTEIATAIYKLLNLKPSTENIYGPGGLMEHLAQAMGLSDPNVIITGAQLRIPPAEFFEKS